jgi:hypothetical protein
MPLAKGIIGRCIKKTASNVSAKLRDEALFKDGGVSHLLSTNADEIDMLCVASTRDYTFRTNLRFCESK